MLTIIGISGKRGSGKSLLCNPYLKRLGFEIMSFAEKLKEDVRLAYGLTKEHTDGKLKEIQTHLLGGKTPREAMIAEGRLRREFSENGLYWVKKVFSKINKLQKDSFVAIEDVRFKNEADYIKAHNGYLIRLERDKELNIYKTELADNSETELDNYQFDLILPKEKNKTPQDLEKFAYEVLEWLKKKSN